MTETAHTHADREECGPEGCQIDWLASERIEVDDDPVAFTKLATDAGWGDGLPLVPPTEARVRDHVAASGRFPEECLAELPPRNGRTTVEKLAINAVMAGAAPEAMPLLCAAVEAMADPVFNLFALNTTTSCVVPGLFVNGPARHDLDIPYDAGCFGGDAGPGPAIGRATRLVMRNVAGQRVGVSSKSVFGQPGRVAGIVVGEWEERSPWAPLAERRGVAGNAVTVHGCTGTVDVADIVADNGADLLELVAKSLAFPGTNAFIGAHHGAEILVCLAPPWAELIAASYPTLEDVQDRMWAHAALPVAWWPDPHRRKAEENGRIDGDGTVHLVEGPDHMIVMVCGGLGNLHALALHSFGPTRAVYAALLTVPGSGAVVVGTSFGARVHVPALRAAGFTVVALVGRDAERTRRRAARLGVPHAVTSLDAALALPDVDAVTIATPPDTHCELALAALGAARHVICEKPFALDTGEAGAMLHAAEAAGVTHLVGHEFRWASDRATAGRAIADGAIGEPRLASFVQWMSLVADPDTTMPRWWFDRDAGGGWLGASGSHVVDQIRVWLGEITTVSANLALVSDRPERAAEDSFTVRLELGSGAHAVLQQTAGSWGPPVAVTRVAGTRGTVWLDDGRAWVADASGSRPLPVPADLALPPSPETSDDPRHRFTHLELGPYTRLCEVLRAGVVGRPLPTAVPIPTFADGAACTRVLDAIRASAGRAGETVRL